MTTLHEYGGVLGWPLDAFFWALTNSWSRLLARVGVVPNLKEIPAAERRVGAPNCAALKWLLVTRT